MNETHNCCNCLKPILNDDGTPIKNKNMKYCRICRTIVTNRKNRERYRKKIDSMTPEQKEEFFAAMRRKSALYRYRNRQRCLNCLRLLYNKRGNPLKDKRIKYCHICRPQVEEKKKQAREQRYRDTHKKEIRKKQRKWCRKHREQRNLTARNYVYRHPEKHKDSLQSWRKRNPEKVSLQNKRAKINMRKREKRTLRLHGKYTKIKWPVKCPECEQTIQTSAKRPQCNCGHVFQRDFMEKLIDNAQTKPCKSCGREIPFPDDERGRHREYCECCFPQIQALKRVFQEMKRKPDAFVKSYRRNTEFVVAVTCIFCDEIILGHRGKKVCPDCQKKWCRQIPQAVSDTLAKWYSFKLLPPDLRAWKRIQYHRKQGIYTL
jgi:hypothetical protein